MSDTTSPTQSDALNSFSIGSVLGVIWDDTKNAFNTGLTAAANVLTASAVTAAAAAQKTSDAQRQTSLTVPTVPVSAGLDTKTMIFLGAAIVAALFVLKGK